MNTVGFWGSVITVIAFVVFIGICVWAYSSRRADRFKEDENAPFALDDDHDDGRVPGAQDENAGSAATDTAPKSQEVSSKTGNSTK